MKKTKSNKDVNYFLIQQDAFLAMSDWHFDAILELSRIRGFKLEPKVISVALGISVLQARLGLQTLERLELLVKNVHGQYQLQHLQSTNILDPDFTSAANRKYQRSVLEKSIQSLEQVERKLRDHTSTTLAINRADIQKVKTLIEKFRQELDAFLQRKDVEPNDVFQLHIGFFPLTKKLKKEKTRRNI